jgi:hypothetical protein
MVLIALARSILLNRRQPYGAGRRGAPFLSVHQHGQELLELPLALRRDQSAFKQNSAQLVDQSRPLADQTVSGSVKRSASEGPMSMASTSRRPSVLTPTATMTATDTMRWLRRTFT